jgi:hypothetical protein
MEWGKRVMAGGVLAVFLAGSVTACSVAGCSGSRQSTASVAIDATAWVDAHPGHVLSVCLDDACADVTTKNTITARSSEPNGHKFLLTATDTTTKAEIGRKSSRLFASHDKTPCGDVTYPTGTIQITTAGELVVRR